MSSREEFPSSLELYCKCKSEFVHFHAYEIKPVPSGVGEIFHLGQTRYRDKTVNRFGH